MWWGEGDCSLFRSFGDAVVSLFPIALVLVLIGLLFWLH